MFNKLENIRKLEVELSTFCNALSCPQDTIGELVLNCQFKEQHLRVETVTKLIEQIPNAKETLELHLTVTYDLQ